MKAIVLACVALVGCCHSASVKVPVDIGSLQPSSISAKSNPPLTLHEIAAIVHDRWVVSTTDDVVKYAVAAATVAANRGRFECMIGHQSLAYAEISGNVQDRLSREYGIASTNANIAPTSLLLSW